MKVVLNTYNLIYYDLFIKMYKLLKELKLDTAWFYHF